MGSCIFRGFAEAEHVIKVVTSNGGIMELYPPITAECITNEFPGHVIYNSHDLLSPPLLYNEELLSGEVYHLLPVGPQRGWRATREDVTSAVAPYRMSFDSKGVWRREEGTAAVTAAATMRLKNYTPGMWKVKLVITPGQLTEILSQEATTEALIESVRTVAKCGSGFASAANSDQWSLASSWKATEHFP